MGNQLEILRDTAYNIYIFFQHILRGKDETEGEAAYRLESSTYMMCSPSELALNGLLSAAAS